ncbi:hypothetical protein [Actinokineospora globicatena]|uniref:Uncharacterized protein n=1 Tax=Actinokineospora globicatena TaxID=103729 RepID=A0A9W6V9A1_9PSEU|nr:hypothetical protein [Actinokineospora globicatena]GLW91759.1 hypothetical protein Aglo03_25750 [Actinokineospora globicatena]
MQWKRGAFGGDIVHLVPDGAQIRRLHATAVCGHVVNWYTREGDGTVRCPSCVLWTLDDTHSRLRS